MKYFITAIGTDSGKTVVSAIFCEALKAAYWKPIQAGFPTDSDQIKKWCPATKVLKEAFVLNTPVSPHASARIDGVRITASELVLPISENLVVEGAGGILVPINNEEFIIDVIEYFNIEVILVSNLYLGSINHTLLSIELLKQRNIKIRGIVFNGKSNPESESIILKYANAPCILRIKQEVDINTKIIKDYANQLITNLKNE